MRPAIALSIVLASAACGGENAEPLCDPTALRDALAAAEPGADIAVGACRIEGDFTVAAPLRLHGGGPSSVLAGRDVTLTVEAPQGSVQIEDLTVEGGARAGVRVRSADTVALTRVALSAASGVALGAEDVGRLALAAVTARGPVDQTNQDQVAYPPDRAQIATHGIVAVRVADLAMTDVSAEGFAGAGVLLIGSETRWDRGDASVNLGIGLHVQGGHATLADVHLDGTFRGTWGVETYGGAFTASAAVDSTNLTVDDNWYGLLQHGGVAHHLNLSASGNQNAGIWAQYTTELELQGTIADNDFAGVVAFDAGGVFIHDSTIQQTHQVLRPNGEVGTIMIGDGIQLVESLDGARLSELDLIDNERVGLLIELGGGTFSPSELAGVRVSQSSGNGAVCQHGTKPVGWDSGVSRTGVTSALDHAVTDLDTVAVVGPCGRPVELSDLAALGL